MVRAIHPSVAQQSGGAAILKPVTIQAAGTAPTAQILRQSVPTIGASQRIVSGGPVVVKAISSGGIVAQPQTTAVIPSRQHTPGGPAPQIRMSANACVVSTSGQVLQLPTAPLQVVQATASTRPGQHTTGNVIMSSQVT